MRSVISWTRISAVACLWLIAGCGRQAGPLHPPGKPPIRVAVIGGMTLSGMWQALSERFTRETGWPVELVVSGPKDTLAAEFRRGDVDLLTMHSSDQATTLVGDGYAVNMRPWARNEHAIVGPQADPAGIRGGHDGAAALRRIAETHSPFVDFTGPGSREIVHGLWKKAGMEIPKGDWLLKDESLTPQGILEFAAAHQAYVVVGRIPVLRGKMANEGKLEILVQGDPAMRRPYVVVEANPAKLPHANVIGARVLADYMTSEKGRAFLADFAARQPDGFPLFYPADTASPFAVPPVGR
jgi:tungstate transport system substrate-binding protein